MSEVPLVCRECGKPNTIYASGTVLDGAWRDCKVMFDSERGEICIDEGPIETEPLCSSCDWEQEDYHCSECQATKRKIEDLVVPAHGVDRLGRWLDADGIPHGPPQVHPRQTALEVT